MKFSRHTLAHGPAIAAPIPQAIAYPALNKVKDYPTTFRPYRIFRNGNTIISAGMTLPGQPFPYMIIEKIEL